MGQNQLARCPAEAMAPRSRSGKRGHRRRGSRTARRGAQRSDLAILLTAGRRYWPAV